MADSTMGGGRERGDVINAADRKLPGPDAVEPQTNVPYGSESGDEAPGWLRPDSSPIRSGPPGGIPPSPGRNLRRIGCLIALLLLALPLIATAVLDATGPGGTGRVSVGFGTGGSECTLTGTANSYVVGTPVRLVVTLSPAPKAGATVTITTMREGAERVSSRETVEVDPTDTCVFGTLPELEVGHHVVRVAFDPSSTPPVEAEIDITPK